MAEEVRDGARRICALIDSGNPFFVGRNGTIELQILYYWAIQRNCGKGAGIPSYPPNMADILERHAGVFPPTDASIDAWCSTYVDAFTLLDGTAAGWYKPLAKTERALLDTYSKTAFRCPLRSLEPYYVEPELQWTRRLGGQRVCVVTSFRDTVEKQIARGLERVWPDGLLAPETIWLPIQTGYAPRTARGVAEWPEGIQVWQDAVKYVVDRLRFYAPQTVIIGCGGLGMVIGAAARRMGMSVIVLGGATQLLFGVKGKRWENHDVISTFWNDAWVWPSASETPAGAGWIEGGCYWG